MNEVKKLIQNLSLEEWKQLYRWALQEESVRREKEELRLEIIQEVLAGENPEEAEAVEPETES
ncbi:hypothetical protein R3O64_09645 [Corynebacterium hesseae]|uniref:hypothetical protein n=1 Tax=Corynebacterium hesseae TaxID=2913502 RepID=UPI0030CE48F6